MTSTGLRERKKQDTRVALRTAALQLTAERGLDKVTVEEIAAAADVSVRTFFNYFSSKEEAVIGADPDWMVKVVDILAARPVDEEPLHSLHAVFRDMSVALVEAREVHVLRRKVLADNPGLLPRHTAAFVDFETTLNRAITERTKRDSTSEADTALVVAAAVTAMRVSVDLWVAGEGPTELSDLLDRAFHRLAVGFITPTGRTKATPRTPHKARAKPQPDTQPARKR
jgi:AcrR family transcriptional regulator